MSSVEVKLSTRQELAKQVALGNVAEQFVRLDEVADWDDTPMPEVTSRFSSKVSWTELNEEIENHRKRFGTQAESYVSIVRTLALYAGITPVDEAARRHFVFDPGHSPTKGFPSIRLNMLERRPATFRGIPTSWRDHLESPIYASGDGEHHLKLWFKESDGTLHDLGRTPTLRPMTLYPLVYRNTRSDDSLTINPRQDCPMRCTFCRRGYHRLEESHFTTFDAAQMASVIHARYPNFDFSQIRIVTGAFMGFEHMRSYIETLVTELSRLSKGRFDPRTHDTQSIYVLTHLARTEAQILALSEVGVKGIEDSVEIFDDTRRRNVMPKALESSRAVGKGDQPFQEILPAVEAGVRILGTRYSVAIVIGLDDLGTSLRGFTDLKNAGLQSITTALFVPYGLEEVSLQQMTFSEALVARREARLNFLRAF